MIPPTLIQQCAPRVSPATMAAIVRVESGGNPLAMWNNGTRAMVIPGDLSQARQYLSRAMAAGQRVDVGLAQVDTENFAAYGLTPANAFDACTNLKAGAAILRRDWRQALAAGYHGQQALYHAFEAYNSGRLWGDSQYAVHILAAAGIHVGVGPRNGLAYRIRKSGPLAFVETWGYPKAAPPKSVKPGAVYVLNW
ncbi:MAG: lytic transglycosylase domain-containing protein [Sulfuriferula sp.]